MKASDAIAVYLSKHNVTDCFEMIGGMITHVVDSFAQHGAFSIISMHHEQSAAFAAEGISRKNKGKSLGLAMATSGPGATNLITGIGNCWFDSIPCLFITGQVNTSELKGDRPIRQQGFQELDIVSLVRPITKYAFKVMSSKDILPELHKALTESLSGRQGPVLLDIPNNIQREEIPDEIVDEWAKKSIERLSIKEIDPDQIAQLKFMCSEAQKPLFLIGGGAKWSSRIGDAITSLIKIDVPYISTLMGQENLNWSDNYFGMVGTYGNRTANYAIQNCDLLIVVGSRLDIRQTGSNIEDFARHAKIVQIDIDAGQINNRIHSNLSINVSSDQFFKQCQFDISSFPLLSFDWTSRLKADLKKTFIDEYFDWKMSPFRMFQEINSTFHGQELDFVCDVGNHQMWAATCLRLNENQAIHHSGGMAAMGFALPTAIGISAISKGKTVVLTGDGSLQVNIQELDTLVRIGSNILIIVFNNQSLGMVKNFQDMYFEGRNQSSKLGYSCPSFSRVAESFGIESYIVYDDETFRDILSKVKALNYPVLIEVIMEYATECRPRLLFGNTIDKQSPLINHS